MSNSTAMSQEIHHDRETCLLEILKRVTASQLGICSCVSKKWYSLITSSFFISTHTKTLPQFQSSNLFLIRTFSEKNPLKKHKELYHFCSFSPEKTLKKKTLICPFKTQDELQFRMVGSVNGVILLSDDFYRKTDDFILWNPLVGCYIQVPKPVTPFEAMWMYIYATGFGYDEVNDDYKLVRVVYHVVNDGSHGTYLELVESPPALAELYSVKEGVWRSISADYVEYLISDVEWSQCFLKGNVHWVAFERWGKDKLWTHKSSLLLLFNVVKEKFQKMNLPLVLRSVFPVSLVVSECQGLLCVHHFVKTEMPIGELKHAAFNMWIKKEYNKRTSWIKVAKVDFTGSSVPKDIYWRRHGELPYLIKGGELVSFDPDTNVVVALEKGCRGHYEVWSFTESLAFLNKDCKNRRSLLLAEGVNGCNDDEDVEPGDAHLVGCRDILPKEVADMRACKLSKHLRITNQMMKFGRDF